MTPIIVTALIMGGLFACVAIVCVCAYANELVSAWQRLRKGRDDE